MIWRIGSEGGLVEVDFRGLFRNATGILCCPGTSLEARRYGGYGRIVFALNTAFDSSGCSDPDVWVGVDEPRCYNKALWHSPGIMKFERLIRLDNTAMGERLRFLPNMYFMEDCPYPAQELASNWKHQFMWLRAGFWYPVILAMVTGVKQLYLCGCDWSNEKGCYCHGDQLDAKLRKKNDVFYGKVFSDLRQLHGVIRDIGMDIRSATPNSPQNEFLQYQPIADVLARLDGKNPFNNQHSYWHCHERPS